MKLALAPMEGIIDCVLRELLTDCGGIDFCVTEFIRVTHYVHSDEIFYKYCPELKTSSRTAQGTPVIVQLLGSDAEQMAANAVRACELGAQAIDLNFGCPAKTVNRHDGGAVLLKTPDRLFEIASTVRQAVPKNKTVSAKIRLGFDDPSQCLENAVALEHAQVDWITVHCRTKTDGYRPPAYWEWIPKIKEVVKTPIVVNGEIWTKEDFEKCRDLTQCDLFMIGRGALRDPFLFAKIKGHAESSETLDLKLRQMLLRFYQMCLEYRHEKYAVTRSKQWLQSLATNEKWRNVFEHVKTLDEKTGYLDRLKKNLE